MCYLLHVLYAIQFFKIIFACAFLCNYVYVQYAFHEYLNNKMHMFFLAGVITCRLDSLL